jgi:hypothetical protein
MAANAVADINVMKIFLMLVPLPQLAGSGDQPRSVADVPDGTIAIAAD